MTSNEISSSIGYDWATKNQSSLKRACRVLIFGFLVELVYSSMVVSSKGNTTETHVS